MRSSSSASAVIATPAAVSEGKERDAHRHGAPASVVEQQAVRKTHHEARHGDKKVTYVFKGSYASDLRDGDKVLLQARLPRRAPGAAPFSARKLVDQTRAEQPADDQPAGSDAPESTDS